VYLADVRSENDFVQRLAIKVLNLDMLENDDIVARQRDEARLLAQLNHDHIVKVIELTEIDGRPALLMEYVEGVDASRLLKSALFPPRAALEVGGAVASALHTAFNACSPVTGKPLRVVHRDIKPANVVITANGGVKVLDFGVARAEFEREGLTQSVAFGTARYMAPESWMTNDIGAAVDLYALGISLVEMLSGQQISRCPLSPRAYEDHVDALVLGVDQPEWGVRWKADLHALLHSMLTWNADDRPNAGECSERMLDLSERTAGESLRRFAPRYVPELIAERRDKYAVEDASGFRGLSAGHSGSTQTSPSMLTGSKLAPELTQDASQTGTVSVQLAAGLGGVAVVSLGLMVGGLAFVLSQNDADVVAPVAAPTVEASEVEIAEPAAAVDEPDPTPATRQAQPKVEVVEPVRATSRAPATAKTATPAATPDPAATFSVTVDSEPQGAKVFLDGQMVGMTPTTQTLAGKSYQLKVVSADATTERSIKVEAHAPTRFIWLGGDNWVSGY